MQSVMNIVRRVNKKIRRERQDMGHQVKLRRLFKMKIRMRIKCKIYNKNVGKIQNKNVGFPTFLFCILQIIKFRMYKSVRIKMYI